MRTDAGLAHAHETGARTFRANTLAAHPCTLDQQEQFIGQELGLRKASIAAQMHQALALRFLECLDYLTRRMLPVWQLNGGIRKRAAALVGCANVLCHELEPTAQLLARLAGMYLRQRLPFASASLANSRRHSATNSSFDEKCR